MNTAPHKSYTDLRKKEGPNALERDVKRFSILPDYFKQAIRNFDYDNALVHFHKKYRLHIDQSAAIEKAITDIVFGDIHSHEIVPIIMNSLRINQKEASEIALDISTNILVPIREEVKRVQEDEWRKNEPGEPKETLREVL